MLQHTTARADIVVQTGCQYCGFHDTMKMLFQKAHIRLLLMPENELSQNAKQQLLSRFQRVALKI
jgi:hypothetical protein